MAVIKRVSLVDQVYEKLRERIVQLKIPFGSKLNVSKLQEEYGVSSTPVREALNRLLNEGLIEFENNVGARVIDITEEDVREIQEIAFAYQMVAARNALRNGDAQQMADEIGKYAEVVIASEDGSVGTKGNVIDAIRAGSLKADVIYACGPTPMVKALKAYAAENGIECWISLEEKMACGIGACLGCVCHSKDVDEHSNVKNKRVCKDGPVFLADEVELLSSEEQRERIAGGCMCGTVKVKED